MAGKLKLPPAASAVDMVNAPPHYIAGKVECIDAIESALGPEGYIGFLRGQVIKYTWRLAHKGSSVMDAEKAEAYLKMLIATLKEHT